METALFSQLQLSKASRDSGEVSSQTRVWGIRLTMSNCDTDWYFFPVWVKLILPQTILDKSYAVLKRICSRIPPGLIIFDRGFAWRKVFTMALDSGHHILCHAKSNTEY